MGHEFSCLLPLFYRKSSVHDISRLRQEAEIMASLKHNNIVQYIALHEDANYIYIIQELCEGGDLFSHISQLRRYTSSDAAYLARQLLAAVNHLHKHNLLHRDIKPDNILVCKAGSRPYTSDPSHPAQRQRQASLSQMQARRVSDADSNGVPTLPLSVSTPSLEWNPGTVKLCDFGLASYLRPARMLRDICGTYLYMAPEVINAPLKDPNGRFITDGYGTAADLWSVGVCIFALTHGYVPFQPIGERWSRCTEEEKSQESRRLIRAGFKPKVYPAGHFGPYFTESIPVEPVS